MRNYSFNIPSHNAFMVSTYFDDSDVIMCVSRLLRAFECHKSVVNIDYDMETNLFVTIREVLEEYLTSSELTCVVELLDWLWSIRHREQIRNPAKNGAWAYSNLNTGENLVFVCWYGYGDFELTSLG